MVTGGSMGGATDVALDSNGSIVAVGSSRGSPSQFAVARYLPDGSLDRVFGNNGIVTTPFDDADARAAALAIQPDGDIVVAGARGVDQDPDFALVRYQPDGHLDLTFGIRGRVATDFGGSGQEWADAVAIQADGSIVAAGTAIPEIGPCGIGQQFGVARYLPDGAPDRTFGTDGMLTTEIDGGSDNAHDIMVQPDGKLVVAGLSDGCGNGKFVVVRYLGS